MGILVVVDLLGYYICASKVKRGEREKVEMYTVRDNKYESHWIPWGNLSLFGCETNWVEEDEQSAKINFPKYDKLTPERMG